MNWGAHPSFLTATPQRHRDGRLPTEGAGRGPGRGGPRVVVADEQAVVRIGLGALLASQGMELAGEAGTAEQAVEVVRRIRPDVVMLDLQLPERGGFWALAQFRAVAPSVRPLVFTASDGDEAIRQALEAGARGYLLKTAGPEAVLDAVRALQSGLRFLPQPVAARMAEHLGRPQLSPREHDVVALMVAGLTNREIGARLHITEGTAKLHVSRILGKLCVRDRTAAVTAALRRGIVPWSCVERSAPDAMSNGIAQHISPAR